MCTDYRNYRTKFSSIASKPFIDLTVQNSGAWLFKILISLKLCGLACEPPFQFWPQHVKALDQYSLNFHHVRLIKPLRVFLHKIRSKIFLCIFNY